MSGGWVREQRVDTPGISMQWLVDMDEFVDRLTEPEDRNRLVFVVPADAPESVTRFDFGAWVSEHNRLPDRRFPPIFLERGDVLQVFDAPHDLLMRLVEHLPDGVRVMNAAAAEAQGYRVR